jgi:sugar phosphate isomerase/epimerase
MPGTEAPMIAVSTWSIHRALGVTFVNGPGSRSPFEPHYKFGTGALTLHQLPRELSRRGFHRVEICHFHLASTDVSYLRSLRATFDANAVVVQTLLIDDGDLSDSNCRERDIEWIAEWIEVASNLGAEHVRVIAGKSRPTTRAIDFAIDGLSRLAEHGQKNQVRVVTENWFDLLPGSKEVHFVLDALEGRVGLLADTCNWTGPGRYKELESIFARAELCHAKCHFGKELEMDTIDFGNCLNAAIQAGYSGPFTLIYEGSGDEWCGLEQERQFLLLHRLKRSELTGLEARTSCS